MLQHFGSYRTSLDNTTLLSDISPKDLYSAGLTVRIVDGTYRARILYVSALDVLAYGLSRNGYRIDVTLRNLRRVGIRENVICGWIR